MSTDAHPRCWSAGPLTSASPPVILRAHAAEYGAMFELGREYAILEALTLVRRATFDPGVFTQRVRYSADEMETLERWQARAALVALSPAGVPLEAKWSQAVGHFTTYEVAELERLSASGVADV